MSKNTQIGELINYISVNESGNVVLSNGHLVATQNYVSTAVANLVDAAPATLDTLNELAAALGDDPNFATTVTNSIGGKLSLTGGTLSGALNGTSATFSSIVTAGGQVSINSGFGTSTPAISIYNNTGANVSNVALIDFRLNNTFGGNERIASITALNPNASANNGGALVFSVSANGTATTPTEDMRITSAGNVGIGTHPTNPGKKLEISDENNSTSTTSGLKIVNWSLTANARAGIVFQSYDNNGAAIWSNRTGTTTGELIFGTNNSASTAETNIAERMRIYSDGVVTTRTIQLNDPTYFASNFYGIRLAGVDNGVNGTNFQVQGRTSPTGGFSTLFTITNAGAATFSSSVTAKSNITVSNNGAEGAILSAVSAFADGYRATLRLWNQHTGGKAWEVYSTNDADGLYGGGKLAFVNSTNSVNALVLASTGAATFSSSVSAGGNISTSGALFAVGDVLTTGGRLLASNGSQGANTETASILLGNRGYFTTSDIGAARISAVAMGTHWYSGTGLAFYTNPGPDVTSRGPEQRMRIASGGTVNISNLAGTGSRRVFANDSGDLSAPQTDTTYTISLSGITTGSWFNITAHNFSGFQGLVQIQIQNLNSDHGYFVLAAAWIFQQGHNGDPSYAGIRGVTIRPDGTSYEGYNVVESYHTAPISGRYNMRMRLRVRDAGLAAANPINLQIWVDHVVGITNGTTSLTVRSF